MGRITSTVRMDGAEVERDSQLAYTLIADALKDVQTRLNEVSVIVPSILRDDLRALGQRTSELMGDASEVAADLKRWDGDHDKAMAERDFRRKGR